MDDLAELQALLGAVQKQETKNRLNERNCRELLVKLIQKEFVEVRRACVRRGLVLTASSLARVRVRENASWGPRTALRVYAS